jgi:dynein regulatory complex subunit 2
MRDDFDSEREILRLRLAKEKHELEQIVKTIDDDENKREAEAKYAFDQLKEELRTRALENVNMLRISLDTQIEELGTTQTFTI